MWTRFVGTRQAHLASRRSSLPRILAAQLYLLEMNTWPVVNTVRAQKQIYRAQLVNLSVTYTTFPPTFDNTHTHTLSLSLSLSLIPPSFHLSQCS
jgi:hypothetical protein